MRVAKCPERGTRIDGLQLLVVAYQNHLRAGLAGMGKNTLHQGGPHHRGLINHDDIPAGELGGFEVVRHVRPLGRDIGPVSP